MCDRLDRLDRPGRLDKLDRLGRPGRLDKLDRPGRLDKKQGVEAVSELWRESQFVVFFGAGVSRDSGLPTGDQLEEELKRPLTSDAKTRTKLRRMFLNPTLKPNGQHRLLALLFARFYITTNWDRLLKRSFEELLGPQCSDRFHVVVEEGDISNVHKKSHTCIHLHGDLEKPDTVVWTDGDYSKTIQKSNLVDDLVAVLLAMHPTLFLGYSLRDLNVIGRLIGQSEWDVGILPERFAVLSKHDRNAIDRCQELGIQPICLDAKGEELGAEVEDFLTRLWERIEGYRIYTRPLDDGPEDTVQSRYERLWALYRAGQFLEARAISDQFLGEGIDWRQDVPLFARFAYFTVKVNDKLEDWKRVKSLDADTLQPEFKRIERVLPVKAFEVIKSQYEAGLAMPLLRSGQLKDALIHIDKSLKVEPQSSADPDLMCLYGDRFTIRAITRLAMWASRRKRTASSGKLLDDARKDLAEAEKVFRKFGKMGEKEEVHYLGRFYGARAFIGLALIDSQKADEIESDSLPQDSQRAHTTPNCVPYGELAGKYCEAYCLYRLAIEDVSSQQKRRQPKQEQPKREWLTTALDILQDAEKAVENPRPLARAKIYALAVLIAGKLSEIEGQHTPRPDYQAALDSALDELRKDGHDFVDTVGLERWLMTRMALPLVA